MVTSDDQDDQDLGKQAITAREKLSAYFTIAAAAFGLISDGCKLVINHRGMLRTDDANIF